MARYIAWIGERGTVKATSMQSYLSAVNDFFKDHGVEPIAQCDLVAKVRRGLARPKYPSTPTAHACICLPGFSSHRYASPRTYARR
jgi:hypothetical protein